MPNHCSNILVVDGDTAQRKQFFSDITKNVKEGEDFAILLNLYPTPKDLEIVSGSLGKDTPEQAELERKQAENKAKHGFKDWYDWNNAKWGSKWGDYESQIITNTDTTLVLEFTTAWSPIINGLVKVSEQYPLLEFNYAFHEGGMGFVGGVGIKNGEVISEIDEEYPSANFELEGDAQDLEYERQEEALGELLDGILATLKEGYNWELAE
jgi:hypothetical protein